METIDIIIEVLEKSVKKNGEIQLTNRHLLNILKMAVDVEQQRSKDRWMESSIFCND
jgi:hypothetical protein